MTLVSGNHPAGVTPGPSFSELRRRAEGLKRVFRFIGPFEGPGLREALAAMDPSVARAVVEHGLAPLVVSKLPADLQLPAVAARELAIATVLTRRLAQTGQRTFMLVHGALSEAKISSVALKGHSLATRVYSAAPVRRASDVDVLVRPEDLTRAVSALQSKGFVLRVDPHADEHHHLLLAPPDGHLPVDLHFRLQSGIGRHIDVGAVFERARFAQGDFAGPGVLCAEDELVYLCVHAAVHGFTPLLLLEDIRRLAERGFDRAVAARRAREWKVELATCLAVDLVEHWTGHSLGMEWTRRPWRATALRPLFCDELLAWGIGARAPHANAFTFLLLSDRWAASTHTFALRAARFLTALARSGRPQ